MATVNPSGPHGHLRGKVGGMVYALQPDGTITVRSLGEQTAESTEGEQKGQHRMQLGHDYVHGVLGDPALRSAYDSEAQTRKMRSCDLIMSDFLTDPVISGIDTAKYRGQAGGWLLIIGRTSQGAPWGQPQARRGMWTSPLSIKGVTPARRLGSMGGGAMRTEPGHSQPLHASGQPHAPVDSVHDHS
jgi:hypothetical protein